jgi:PAS domain S-box-containing protein
VDSATDGIITLDDEQRIILFNPSAEEIFGHKAAAIFTQPFNCLLPKRLRALQSQLPRNKLIAGEIGYPCRMRGNFIGLRANGEEFPMETSISEATIEEKSFFTLIVRDVAERQRTEETRARLAAIVESSHDAIIGKSLDGTITNWNKGAELLFGFAAAEIIGKSSSIFIPRDRLEEEMHLLARWQRDQTVTRYETVRLCKNGRLIDVSMSVSPIWGAGGQIAGISKVARVITEQKRAEKELQRSEKHFRLLIENASDLITVVNAKGIIGFHSPSVKRNTRL